MAGHDPAGTMGMKPPEVNSRVIVFVTCLFCKEYKLNQKCSI